MSRTTVFLSTLKLPDLLALKLHTFLISSSKLRFYAKVDNETKLEKLRTVLRTKAK